MKKMFLFASALMGVSVMAQAQEVGTVKTTTVQYQVPACTSCRTTSYTSTTVPEPKPLCETCAQTVAPVKKEVKTSCKSNHELGIRNPLFVLKKGQISAQEVAGVFKEPKRKVGQDALGSIDRGEYRGWQAYMRMAYGITDRWTIQAFGGKKYTTPKTDQYVAAEGRPVPHFSGYDVTVSTNYHLADYCHFDLFVGVDGTWHREKTKHGSRVERVTGWSWAPTATIGSTWGWFTGYLTASYTYDHTKTFIDPRHTEKDWVDEHGYYYNPGVYIQPSKWYAIDFNIQKSEGSNAQWNVGLDVYPYKNLVVGFQLNARKPFSEPMHMYGASAVVKAVF